ncbi:MAG TPA: PQQ-dependent sugar dehydrogenase [Pyrinomonadaceae bacterium]|nr:PQQ-dependent sugar dehydrogenase [Pyrinomonadaceae bacterium]
MKSRDSQRSGRLISRVVLLITAALALALSSVRIASAATVPPGFTDSLVAAGLTNPTAMAFAPDGRIFVCEQGGTLRVIKNGALLPTPFLTVTVDSSGERGLLGVAFDPNFDSNQLVYVYYTATTPTVHNRISHFTADGDVAMGSSEIPVMDLNDLSTATNHNGGAIHFGTDGNLYVAVGDNANGNNAQSFSTRLGKMLRISSTGSIPLDNPFLDRTTGDNRAIWALGLRNPFTFSFQPGVGRMFINDVGQNTWEEINDGIAGSNYGWPTCEGFCNPSNASFRDPIFAYANDAQTCAITGGAFYNPQVIQFPSNYVGNYFFADFCGGWIKTLNPANGNAVADFATGISLPVDLQVSADGFLYYLARGAGSVNRIGFPTGDTTAPTVSIVSPLNGSTVVRKSNVTIAASASDNVGVARVEFLVNGVLQCSDVIAPYSCNWRVPSPPNKPYQIQARAFDAAGNFATAAVQVTSR